MPRFLSLDVVPYQDGAQVFMRDGHGQFVPDGHRWCPDHEQVIKTVREFLEWEHKTYAAQSTGDRPQ